MKRLLGLFFLTVIASGFVYAAFNVTQVQSGTDSGFGIANVIQSPDRVYPGDQVSLRMSFYTSKVGGASNVVVTPSIPFLTTTSVFSMGNLVKDQLQSLSISFTVPATAKAGTYPFYMYASDASSPQKLVALIEMTVNENENPSLLVAEANVNDPLQVGGSGGVQVALTNTGHLDADDVIIELQTNKSGVFTALQTDRKFVSHIPAGKTVSVPFEVGVGASSAPGYYPLSIKIQYVVDKVAQIPVLQDLGLTVQAKPQLLVTSDRQLSSNGGLTLTITVANVGDTPVRGVYVKASSSAFNILGSSDKFIGTLNLDDSSTLALSLSPRQNGGDPQLDVTVSYKDPLNQEHLIKEQLPVGQGDLSANAPLNAEGAQRFRRNQNQGYFGLNLLQWLGILLAIAIASFFGYRWYKKRKVFSKSTPASGGKR